MPFTPAQADKIIKRLRLTWEGVDGDLNITYRPQVFSKAEMAQIEAMAEGGDTDDDQIATLLCRAIIGWDFLQENGEPYPVTVESIQLLGYGVRADILAGIGGNPDPTKSKRFGRTSAEKRILPAIESEISSTPSSWDGTGEERSLSPIS